MFKIEIQADSIPQLADRLLALGAQLSIPAEVGLQRTVAAIGTALAEDAVSATATAAEPAPRKTRATKPKPEPEVEAAKSEAQVESMTDAARNEAPAEAEAEAPEVQAEVESGIVAADLDFDKDVAPRVLDLVARKGREAMVKVLDEFGAARASEVDAAQWPELLNKLAEAAA